MGRASLQTTLDSDVYQVVKKYQVDRPKDELRCHLIYSYIQHSNSSLKRRPKALLETCIGRVISVLKEDEDEEKTDDQVEDDLQLGPAASGMRPINRPIGISCRGGNRQNNQATQKVAHSETNSATRTKRKRKLDGFEDRFEPSSVSRYRMRDLGGVDHIVEQFSDLLVLPLLQPEMYHQGGADIPRGVLLQGPPGCGKTMISRAFAAELGIPLVEILGPSVVSGMSGESEQKIRERFDEARRLAPCLLFIDEIDSLAPKRESSGSQMEKRIVAQLLLSMDSLAVDVQNPKPVIVLAATNRPDSIDPALRRGGRFDHEIIMSVPTESTREHILHALTRNIRLSPDVDLKRLAKMTAGFVGADLKDLISKAWAERLRGYRRTLEANDDAIETAEMVLDLDSSHQTLPKVPISDAILRFERLVARCQDKTLLPPCLDSFALNMQTFLDVIPKMTPSSKREGFATVPDTTWADIGALEHVRTELSQAIVHPITTPERYAAVGLKPPTGVLLWGPPGCGKTLLAKAVANESKANFISVKGPELFNKYLGESERSVRLVFTRARSSIPCVLFFDELDALVPSRDSGSGNEAGARVVNTFLTELDGLESRDGIYVIAATNRPDVIDSAMLRPGRLEKLLYVGLPGPEERVTILRTLLAGTPIDPGLSEIARTSHCNQFSGADLESLLRQAGMVAMERNSTSVTAADFEIALTKVRSSVQNVERYERLRIKLQSRY